MLGRLVTSIVLLLLAGCAVTSTLRSPAADPATAQCLNLYAAVDQAVAGHGVRPSYPVRIKGFPYLRVNRFLASYRDQYLNTAGLETWLERLAELDFQARAVELSSLPEDLKTELAQRPANTNDLSAALAACSLKLRNHDLNSPERLARLREQASVPSEYRTYYQIVGLYPLTIFPVHYGIYRWHQETHRLFTRYPLETLPVEGELHRFRPPRKRVEPLSPADLPHDSLDIPDPDPDQLRTLFAVHAPIWEIDVAGDFDRPGEPFWRTDGIPSADPGTPVTYRYTSHTRWQGRVLLQLNYLIWFSRRPLTGPLDIYGGALDGLIWRVTLDEKGNPLIYDSIHPCGCYHKFFPTRALQLRPQAKNLPEPPLVPQPAPSPKPGERLVVRVESGTHYIQRVYTDRATGIPYVWRDYRALYAVPVEGNGRRSLFGPDGLVPGAERAERWILWPMGIPSPGGMRERGHHATAFVGRRHFEDVDLFERLFQPEDMAREKIDRSVDDLDRQRGSRDRDGGRILRR